MSSFQFMPPQYRNADANASGFPIDGQIIVFGMARPVTRSPFGKRLYDSRTGAKLTQIQLAKLAGIAQSTLAELERIGQGSSKTLQLAAACGVSPEWLATGSDEKITAAWPLIGVLTPAEWDHLPPEVREDVLSAVDHYVTRHRKKTASASGKFDGSQSDSEPRSAAA